LHNYQPPKLLIVKIDGRYIKLFKISTINLSKLGGKKEEKK
jgi:hypothetical protein